MPKPARTFAVVLTLTAGALILFFLSIRNPESTKPAFIYRIFGPIQGIVTGAQDTIKGVWENYLDLRHVREENLVLKDEIKRLGQERINLLSKQSENIRLRKLLQMKSDHEFPTVMAGVIGEDSTGWRRTIVVNRGKDDGVSANMAVVVAEGIVGRVIKSFGGFSKVLLITDPNMTVDCRSIKSRDRGLVSGSFQGRLIMRYINLNSKITLGDEIVTSGLDGIFPAGLSVGKVESVRKGSQELFLEAVVAPSVEFSSIEEVLIILGQHGGFDLEPTKDLK